MFLRELVSMHSRRRFMDEIQNPTSLINKDYEEIELVTLDAVSYTHLTLPTNREV